MSKKILLLYSLFLSPFLVAQTKKFEVGPVIAVEFPFASNSGNSDIEFDYTPRPSVGAAFKITFTEKFALQPEFTFQLREVKAMSNGNALFRNSPVYVVIPVYANYSLNKNFSLLFGPRLGVDVTFSATYSTGSNGTYSETTGETPEFAGVFGFQYTTPINLFLNVKGMYAFTKPDYSDEINESAIMLGAGWFF
ncbi:outer membrane beta-barrel protein [Aequorivita sp. SDUM287046]|uniref:Outer membrane beta-barrel protein n=1 Tax=Aequorivita aurantiaca TaxID=3053356 RepID=A0ABT8DE83_9FLAO|nr:outer membrane beta-barrel protein [Aequorivita aurantiaca]MDN3723423.1 outer membrane beta-barrel protein [Aequorivita aurantiaca]